MNIVEVYDPALCCSTGVCGPNPDSALTEFASTLECLKQEGVTINRYNLAQEPLAFAQREAVKTILATDGDAALPLIFVNGDLQFRGGYPSCSELAKALDIDCCASSCCSGEETSDCCSSEQATATKTFVKVEAPSVGAKASSCCEPNTGCC